MNQAVDQAAHASQAEPITYRGTTPGGLGWRIELDSAPAIGEKVRGSLSLEGEGQPQVKSGSIAFVALMSRTSTSLELGSMAAGALGLDEEREADPIPTKTTTTTTRLATLEVPIGLTGGTSGHELGTFEVAIPIDSPASVRIQALVIQWNIGIALETEEGQLSLTVSDVPVKLPAARIAQTPHLEAGATEASVSGVKDDMEWSIDLDALPCVPGGSCRGTFLVAATDKWRKARAEVRIMGRVRRDGSATAPIDWIVRAKVVDDRLEANGRRRIDFEATLPPDAFVTTGAGDTRLVATVDVNLVRWLVFGPQFSRPIAVASPS